MPFVPLQQLLVYTPWLGAVIEINSGAGSSTLPSWSTDLRALLAGHRIHCHARNNAPQGYQE